MTPQIRALGGVPSVVFVVRLSKLWEYRRLPMIGAEV
jgi:hypothetical protein